MTTERGPRIAGKAYPLFYETFLITMLSVKQKKIVNKLPKTIQKLFKSHGNMPDFTLHSFLSSFSGFRKTHKLAKTLRYLMCVIFEFFFEDCTWEKDTGI